MKVVKVTNTRGTFLKEVPNVELMEQTSIPRQTSPLVHHPRARSAHQPHFGITADMKVNPNCDHGDILLNPGNKNLAEAGGTLPISGHV